MRNVEVPVSMQSGKSMSFGYQDKFLNSFGLSIFYLFLLHLLLSLFLAVSVHFSRTEYIHSITKQQKRKHFARAKNEVKHR